MQDVPSAVNVLQCYTNTQPAIRCVFEDHASVVRVNIGDMCLIFLYEYVGFMFVLLISPIFRFIKVS